MESPTRWPHTVHPNGLHISSQILRKIQNYMRVTNPISPKKVFTCSIVSVEYICLGIYDHNCNNFEIYDSKYLIFSNLTGGRVHFEKVERGLSLVNSVLNNS